MLFGTDGIRGIANTYPMDAETALRLAMAAGLRFRRGDHRHLVVIGKDTRLSGYLLEYAMTAGFIAMGMDVMLVGPLPTPAVGVLTRSLRCDVGVMISASHNPYQDNGIKFFGPDSRKLSDALQEDIEVLLRSGKAMSAKVHPAHVGSARRLDDAQGRYIEHVKSTFPKGLTLEGLKVVVDCAHGATYRVAPKVLWELGAEVAPLHVQPDGRNINAGCGVMDTKPLAEMVRRERADIGVALDGDGDRVVLVDETGLPMDGDHVLALIAADWRKRRLLRGDGVVATHLSNLGLERFLQTIGVKLLRTEVGDRHVADAMRRGGSNLGGEPSGHIILSDYADTGDGLVAALQVLAHLALSGAPASRTLRCFIPVPQLYRNVACPGRKAFVIDHARVQKALALWRGRLGDGGRVLLRPSGTEPLARIMVQGEDEPLVTRAADDLARVVATVAGQARAA